MHQATQSGKRKALRSSSANEVAVERSAVFDQNECRSGVDFAHSVDDRQFAEPSLRRSGKADRGQHHSPTGAPAFRRSVGANPSSAIEAPLSPNVGRILGEDGAK